MGRSSLLAKELARLNTPVPELADPESLDDQLESGKRKRKKYDDASIGMQQVASKSAPEKRNLRNIDAFMDDPKYAGKKATRKELLKVDSESDEDMGLDSESLEDESSDASEYEQQKLNEKVDHGNKRDMISDDEEEEEEEETESSLNDNEELDDDDEHEMMTLRTTNKRSRTQTKEHVKNQLSLYGEVVGFRIRMQNLMTNALRLPRSEQTWTAFEKVNPEISDSIQSCRTDLRKVLSNLIELRNKVASQKASQFVDIDKISSTSTVKNTASSWSSICKMNNEFEKYCETTFDQWHSSTQNVGRGQKLVALARPISEQVSAMLDGTNKQKIMDRSQMRDSGIQVFGMLGGNEETEGRRVTDHEVYDDSAFYQQLLVQFVASASSSSILVNNESLEDDEVQEKMNRRNKKNQKEQNSVKKIRKDKELKFLVHDKLVNFVSPAPQVESTLDRDQLLASLFAY